MFFVLKSDITVLEALGYSVLGLAIVFAALILLMAIIKIQSALMGKTKESKPAAAPVAAPVAAAASDAAGGMQAASGNDRRKLAAVITAAIAAYEAEHGQAVSGDDYVVRNIRRIRHEAK